MIMNQEQIPTYKYLFPVQTTPTTSLYPKCQQCIDSSTTYLKLFKNNLDGIDNYVCNGNTECYSSLSRLIMTGLDKIINVSVLRLLKNGASV